MRRALRIGLLAVAVAVAIAALPAGAGAATPRGAVAALARGLGSTTTFLPGDGLQAVPSGEGHISASVPRAGWAFSCGRTGSGPYAALPWMSGARYVPAAKPLVSGSVRWPQARFALATTGGRSGFLGNALPLGMSSGAFPVARSDTAARYARDAARLAPQALSGSFPAQPVLTAHPTCISADGPVGVALNGVPILPGFAANGSDAGAREVHDSCGGRTTGRGLYYYRTDMSCIWGRAPGDRPSPLVGYARDGIPIYGPRAAHGQMLHSRDLDACHGRFETTVVRGRSVRVYRYHLTQDFPYTVGCFRARPSSDWTIRSAASAVAPAPGPTPALPPTPTPTLAIAADPALYPSFDPNVSDYVARCVAGQPLNLDVVAPAGTDVAVDGAAARNGLFTTAVPVSSGQEFAFSVTAGGSTSTYHVRCLPTDFPEFAGVRTGTIQSQWYILSLTGPAHYVAIFDGDGVPVWWMRTAAQPMDAKLLPDGNLVWGLTYDIGIGLSSQGRYEEHTLGGTLVKTLTTVGTVTDEHELQPLPNGDYLMDSYVPRDGVDLSPYGGPSNATVLDAEIQEVAPDGTLVWSWNSRDHISLAESVDWYGGGVLAKPAKLPDGRSAYDIIHLNSIEPDGSKIVFSARHLDAVYEIDRATGNIDWKLGGTPTANSLTIAGDPFGAQDFGGQHDARVLPDGTVSLYDDGTQRGRAPRALRFRIDAATSKATLVEQVSDSTVPASACCGSARRLAGGDWVVSWGGDPYVSETGPSGTPVFSLHFAGTVFSYRAVPVLPGVIAASALRAGMDAMSPR